MNLTKLSKLHIIRTRTAAVYQRHGSIMGNCYVVVLPQSSPYEGTVTTIYTQLERPAGNDRNNGEKKPADSCCCRSRTIRHFKAPRHPHESSGRPSGKLSRCSRGRRTRWSTRDTHDDVDIIETLIGGQTTASSSCLSHQFVEERLILWDR